MTALICWSMKMRMVTRRAGTALARYHHQGFLPNGITSQPRSRRVGWSHAKSKRAHVNIKMAVANNKESSKGEQVAACRGGGDTQMIQVSIIVLLNKENLIKCVCITSCTKLKALLKRTHWNKPPLQAQVATNMHKGGHMVSHTHTLTSTCILVRNKIPWTQSEQLVWPCLSPSTYPDPQSTGLTRRWKSHWLASSSIGRQTEANTR